MMNEMRKLMEAVEQLDEAAGYKEVVYVLYDKKSQGFGYLDMGIPETQKELRSSGTFKSAKEAQATQERWLKLQDKKIAGAKRRLEKRGDEFYVDIGRPKQFMKNTAKRKSEIARWRVAKYEKIVKVTVV